MYLRKVIANYSFTCCQTLSFFRYLIFIACEEQWNKSQPAIVWRKRRIINLFAIETQNIVFSGQNLSASEAHQNKTTNVLKNDWMKQRNFAHSRTTQCWGRLEPNPNSSQLSKFTVRAPNQANRTIANSAKSVLDRKKERKCEKIARDALPCAYGSVCVCMYSHTYGTLKNAGERKDAS